MEQIIVQRADNTKYALFQQEPLRTVTKAEQKRAMMSEDYLAISVSTVEQIDFKIGDSVNFGDGFYKLNMIPLATKFSERHFDYELIFEGPMYDLRRVEYHDLDVNGFSTGSEFSITSELSLFIDVLINNLNRRYPGVWKKGTVDQTDSRTENFSGSNCLLALQNICKRFETEFEIVYDGSGYTINVKKVGRILPFVFEYGMPGGLYQLTRQKPEKEIVNILYPFGGTKNIRSDYRGNSLKLKIADPGFLINQASVDIFGPQEASKDFEEIYPKRESPVGEALSNLSFTDPTMDFDLNEKIGDKTTYLIAGTTAKISFNSGNLAGYQFEIEKYDHATKTFTLIQFKDERGLLIPNESPAFQFAPGDKFVLLDIILPMTFETAAEAELTTKGQIYLDQNSILKLPYTLVLSETYIRELNNIEGDDEVYEVFTIGDLITIKDDDLAVDDTSRVIAYTRDMLRHNQYSLNIADNFTVSTIERIISENIEFNNIVRINELTNPLKQRQAWLAAQELINKVFDPDGYFKDGNIRASTIEAMFALFGTNDGQLQLINCTFQPNYGGSNQANSANVIKFTGGSLVHLTIDTVPRTWQLASGSGSFGDDSFRYVYAKCSKTNYSDGRIIYSEQQIKTKEDANYFHFQIGSLSTVDTLTQTRKLSLSYGFTEINGRWITTGRIQSSDGLTYFDLDSGTIGGRIVFRSSNGIEDIEMSTFYDEQKNFAAIVTNAIEGLDGVIETHFYAGVPTLSNQPALGWSTTSIKEDHLNDLYYDTVTNKSYRFVKQGNVYSWQIVNETDISAAMAAAARAQDTADGKRRVFKVTPYPPYDVGDLWTDGADLRVCSVAKSSVNAYSPTDWNKATNYDSTQVVIDQGIVTAGGIYLTGGGQVRAGITGAGGSDSDVRVWSGASFENRSFAPFRVDQGGQVFARKRIEVMNQNNVGQGGLCGSNAEADGTVRAWFGSTYENRNSAPLRFYADGAIISGSWYIGPAGITNYDGSGVFVASSGPGNDVTKAMIGANVVSASTGISAAALFSAKKPGTYNVGAIFEAANGIENYALRSLAGIALMEEALINGMTTYTSTNNGLTDYVDPSLYAGAIIQGNKNGSVSAAIKLNAPSRTMTNMKEFTIFQQNNTVSMYLIDTVRGISSFEILGGMMLTLKWANGFWYVKCQHDNNNY